MEDGEYKTRDGCDVQTHNAFMNIETGELLQKMDDASVELPRFPTNVKGLEDVRLYNSGGNLRFTATSVREYEKDKVRVVDGQYNETTGTYTDVSVLKSPINFDCEKNWLPIENTNTFIYRWFPFEICEKKGDSIEIVKRIPTPSMFSLFRGSAPPIWYNNNLLVLVHLVEYAKCRNYFHCFVELSLDFKPLRITMPFVFEKNGVEYCISFRNMGGSLMECYFSSMDSQPKKAIIDIDKITNFKFNLS